MHIFVLPGAVAPDKAALCLELARTFNVVHLQIEEVIREHAKRPTKAAAFEAAQDELAPTIAIDRMGQMDCQERGWLVGGFPRTVAEADVLQSAGMIADAVV